MTHHVRWGMMKTQSPQNQRFVFRFQKVQSSTFSPDSRETGGFRAVVQKLTLRRNSDEVGRTAQQLKPPPQMTSVWRVYKVDDYFQQYSDIISHHVYFVSWFSNLPAGDKHRKTQVGAQ